MSGWTDERIERLRALWTEGQSASQIAKALGGVTRNAVIGKVNRLGLPGRSKAASGIAAQVNRRYRKVAPAKPVSSQLARVFGAEKVRPIAAPPPPLERSPEGPGSATLLTLGVHMCRWPIGDPLADDFTFCGRRRDEGATYCRAHAQAAYQPAEKRKSANELARSLRRYV